MDDAPRLQIESTRYELIGRIGQGGMGEVLEASDQALGRTVAIKRMLAEPNDRSIGRFLREARVQGRLDHPAVVPVHELGRDSDGRPFFVMKKLAGTTLREVLEGEYSQQRLLRAFADICLAVEYAHARSILHRDIKPENIMLGDFGEVYLLDWGVAKILGETAEESGHGPSSQNLMTQFGTAIGTPDYMSPEQALGDPDIDARTDVFALGCVLFEILTGERYAIARRSGKDYEMPPELEDVCMHAIEDDRDERLASARELATAVQAFLDGDRDLERRKTIAGEHLAKARAALSQGDDADKRRMAMREAGRALALDPTRNEAADMIGKMMLEPPSVRPVEIEQALDQERFDMQRKNAFIPIGGLSILLALTLAVYALTDAPRLLIGSMCACCATLLAITAWERRDLGRWKRVSPFTMMAFGALVVLTARLYSPLLMAPAVATMIALAATSNMQYSGGRFLFYTGALMTLGVLVPFIAEVAGWVSPTTRFTGTAIEIQTGALVTSPTMQIILAALFSVLAIIFASGMGYLMRESQRELRERIHLQAWHLRQLVGQ